MILDIRSPDPGRCKAAVWERDTMRYTGRVKGGFEMHYNKRQCRRKPKASGYCWQHDRLAATPEKHPSASGEAA